MSRVIGADEMVKSLQRLGDEMPQVERRMLQEGGQVMAGAWQYTIGQRGLILTGAMQANVKSKARSVRGVLRAEITSEGKDVHGVRNAAKAYMLHYGTSRIPATHWIQSAEDMGVPLASAAMEEILSEAIESTI